MGAVPSAVISEPKKIKSDTVSTVSPSISHEVINSPQISPFCAKPLKQWTSLKVQQVKNLPTMQETQVQSLGQEVPLEKEMATLSSIIAWRIPWI